jgi:hypothetical protein
MGSMRPPRATLMLQAPAADKKIPPKALTRQLDGLFDSLVRPHIKMPELRASFGYFICASS